MLYWNKDGGGLLKKAKYSREEMEHIKEVADGLYKVYEMMDDSSPTSENSPFIDGPEPDSKAQNDAA